MSFAAEQHHRAENHEHDRADDDIKSGVRAGCGSFCLRERRRCFLRGSLSVGIGNGRICGGSRLNQTG